MSKEVEIHETAIACAFYRMENEQVSKDPFAKHLVNPRIERWAKIYKKEVSQAESIAHSLRHRFFLEELQNFFNNKKEGVFINFGAGFSFYPFLINGNHQFIEIDHLEVISTKKTMISSLQANGQLPQRNIHYFEGDLNDDKSFPNLGNKILQITKSNPTFILIEGVIFYLKKEVLNPLFNLFANIQNKEDFLGTVSYVPEITKTNSYKRLSNFFHNYLNIKQENHNNLKPSFYDNIPGYDLMKHEEFFGLYKNYVGNNCPFIKDDVLNEHLYLLKRKS